ncbi:MAG: hypothetical protein Q8P72_03345 [Candidatus Roizmanbacteria bacterium]|nr:hypothetical protein [Candidatus Roizmanbacteria bacterium]
MLNIKTQVMFIAMITLGYWFLQTGLTSADLVAERKIAGNQFSITTLSFVNINTANFSQLINFFTTEGIVPGGFDAKTVRIEKDGELDVKYSLQTVKRGGDDAFCNSLKLNIVRRDLTEVYNGNLMDLSLQDTLKDGNLEEWILFLNLNASDEELKLKECNFDLYIRTYRNEPGENITGIHATRTLKSDITSGTW